MYVHACTHIMFIYLTWQIHVYMDVQTCSSNQSNIFNEDFQILEACWHCAVLLAWVVAVTACPLPLAPRRQRDLEQSLQCGNLEQGGEGVASTHHSQLVNHYHEYS